MDKTIFGDNQFFGINHMSEEKAQAQLERFRDTRAIVEVLDVAYDVGMRAYMFSTHERVAEICDHLRNGKERYRDLRLYPVLPYAHKYASAVAEKGIAGALSDAFVVRNSVSGLFGTLFRGGVGVLRQDVFEIMKVLIDAEMRMFRGLSLGVVFLQNIVADLLLGLRAAEAFRQYVQYIQSEYAAEAGIMTMNLPAMATFLHECGIDRPIICTSINRAGYLMNPSREAYESVLSDKQSRVVAMSIFASGAIPPREAVEYVGSLAGVEAVVFGASSRSNIVESKALIDQYCFPIGKS